MALTTREAHSSVDPYKESERINGSIWFLIGLATLFLGLRVFCKFRRHKGLWWDDWILILSWLLLIVCGIMSTISLATMLDRLTEHHTDGMNIQGVGLLNLVLGTLLFIAAVWSKTSFALTLIRIAGRRLKLALRLIIISMNVMIFVSCILRWVQCTPSRKIWDSTVDGTCWDRTAILGITITSAAYSAFMDFVLAFMPWPLISKLQMKPSEKVGICVAMSMGVFAGVTGIVKCTKLHILLTDDLPHDVFDLTIWSVAEIATTILAASIPVLRALVREATGSNGRSGCPVVYIREKTREVSGRARNHHRSNNTATVTTASRSRLPGRPDDADSGRAILGTISEDNKIMKMEEVHIRFSDRVESPALEMGGAHRLDRPYQSDAWI